MVLKAFCHTGILLLPKVVSPKSTTFFFEAKLSFRYKDTKGLNCYAATNHL